MQMDALLKDWLSRREAGCLLETPQRTITFSEAKTWIDLVQVAGALVPPDADARCGRRVGLCCGRADIGLQGLFMLWAQGLVPVLLPDVGLDGATSQALVRRLGLCAILRGNPENQWFLEPCGGAAEAPTGVDLPLSHVGKSALVLLTSGTTGLPRALGFSAAALAAVSRLSWRALVPKANGDVGDASAGVARWLSPLPWHHAGGVAPLLRTLPVGGTWLPWLARPFVADEFCRYGALKGATHLSLVPTQLRRILDAQLRPWPTLECVLLSGDTIPASLLDDARGLKWPVVPAYGQTESLGWIAVAPRARLDAGGALIFFPHDGVTVTQDMDDYALSYASPTQASWSLDLATGHIELLGSQIHTRDMIKLSGEGFRVMGRLDDMILCGGENLDPAAIEDAVCRVTGASAAVAFGVADGQWGQIPACVFTLPDETADASNAASRSACNAALRALASLPALLRPRRVCIAQAFELTVEFKRSRRRVALAFSDRLFPLAASLEASP